MKMQLGYLTVVLVHGAIEWWYRNKGKVMVALLCALITRAFALLIIHSMIFCNYFLKMTLL